MKKNIIYKMFLLLFLASGVFLTSCEDENSGKYEMTSGLPTIDYIRYQNKNLEGQLLESATMGDNIVIIGDNLTSVQQVLFNNIKARLNINFITKNTLMLTVPGDLPSEVTDKIYFVNAKLDTLAYDFKVNIAGPTYKRIKCEWVPEGEDVVVEGNSFFATEAKNMRIFIGDYEVPSNDIITWDNPNKVVFKAPATGISGPIEIKTLFGTTGQSKDVFRDSRGMFGDFEDGFVAGWGRPTRIEEDPAYAISGKYVRLEASLTAGEWVSGGNDMTINIWGEDNGIPSGNLFPSDPKTSTLKFEVNVLSDWTCIPMMFAFYAQGEMENYLWADGTQARGVWVPWLSTGSYKSDGWETVSIPLSQFMYNGSGDEVPLSASYGSFGLSLHNRGSVKWAGAEGAECTPRILIDNIRVVP